MKYEKYYSKNSYIISRYLIFECFGIFGIYMVKITKALFAIFLSLLLFSCKSETNYEKGLQAFNNYNYEEAITYLENSLIEDNGINKEDIKMKKKENYPFWFYFDDEEDDYDEDGYYYKKDKTSIDYEVEEDERDNDFQFPIWQDSYN